MHIHFFTWRLVAAFMAAAFAMPAAPANGAEKAFPRVVASIKPVHALVTGVMKGIAEPELLVSGNASPHSYSLRPSQAGAIAQADAIFLIDRNFEAFLLAPLANVADKNAVFELSRGQKLYPYRNTLTLDASYELALKERAEENKRQPIGSKLKGIVAKPLQDEAGSKKEQDPHAHGGMDYHLWLDPQRAIAMVKDIARTMSRIDSANSGIYSRNAANLIHRLDALDERIAQKLTGYPAAETNNVPYLAYHDAYQYFERRYRLAPAATLARHPEHGRRARRYADIARALKGRKLNCILREPQFDARIVMRMAEETRARIITVTPDGALYHPGEEAYFKMLGDLADAVADCRRL